MNIFSLLGGILIVLSPNAMKLIIKMSVNLLSKLKLFKTLNEKLNIPKCFKEIIPDEEKYMAKLDEMAPLAKADGCTKTNPVIPEIDEFKELFIKVYRGE